MAKVKKHKKIPNQPNLRQFFHSKSNSILVAFSLLIVAIGIQRAISGLMLKSDIVYCSPNNMRHLNEFTDSLGMIHHDALVELWVSGVVLSILAGFIIFRSKYLKWILILSFVALVIYVGTALFGESLNKGLACWDF